MILSYNSLCNLVRQGVITNVEPDHINGSSIDVTLGREIMLELPPTVGDMIIELRSKQPLNSCLYGIPREGYVLKPGEFILAHSQQMFHMPHNLSCEIKLKSSSARIGLEHLTAGWCDPGWNGSVLTFELKNMTRYHGIRLHVGDRIGQMVFFQHLRVPKDKSYTVRGRYNGDSTVSSVKPPVQNCAKAATTL